EALTRDLSCELAREGIRVVTLRPHGIPESSTMREVFELKGKPAGMAWEQFTGHLAGTTHSRRVMRLDEVGGLKGSAKHLQLIYGLGGVCYGTTLESVRGATRRALATI